MITRSIIVFFLLYLPATIFWGTVAAESVELTGQLSYLEDRGGKLNIQRITQTDHSASFQPSSSSDLNFGNSTWPYWFKLELDPNNIDSGSYILEIQYGKVGFIELYYQSESGEWHVQKQGIYSPAEKQSLISRNFIFTLDTGALQEPVYLKVENGYLRLNFRLWKLPQFIENEQQTIFLDGLFYGFVLLVLLLNLIFFIFVRERTLLHYAVFLLCISLFYLSGQGWLDVAFSIRESSLVRFQTAFFGVLLSVFGIQFTRSYLKLDIYSPDISRILRFFQYFLPSVSVLAFIVLKFKNQIPGRGTFGAGLLFVLFILLLCLIAALQGVKEKRELAIYYFVATVLFIVLAIVQILSSLQILSTGLHWRLLQWGSVIEMLIFSLGLSRYYRQMQRQRHQLQHELLKKERELGRQSEIADQLRDQILGNVIDPRLFPDLGRIASISGFILYIRAFGNSSEVCYLEEGETKELYLDCSLQSLAFYFGNDFFVRVHKSYLVNPKISFSFRRRSSADYDLIFEDHVLPVGRKFSKQVKETFSNVNPVSRTGIEA